LMQHSTGNWCVVHPDTPLASKSTIAYQEVTISLNTSLQQAPPPGTSLGSMRILTNTARQTDKITMVCGDGFVKVVPPPPPTEPPYKETVPGLNGIPIQEGENYGFSFWVITPDPSINVQPFLMFFGADGKPTNLLSTVLVAETVVNTTAWWKLEALGKAPDNARFLIPGFHLSGRTSNPSYTTTSPPIDIAGVMVYRYGNPEDDASQSPNRFLTLSGPAAGVGELIGADRVAPVFDGFVLGSVDSPSPPSS
jgi:hypothetical protein